MGIAEYERWNGRFSAEQYVFGTEPNEFLAMQKSWLKPGMTALSIADGEGRNSVWLARQGLKVTAFDFTPAGVAKARRLAEQAGVTVDYRQADILQWDWKAAKYDVVAAIFWQFATPGERRTICAGLIETLAPGGRLILAGYTPRQIAFGTGGPKQPEHMYTEALLRDAFASLEIETLVERDAEVNEGPGHSGMSALIEMVARKRACPPEETTP